ncbi:MAG: response regulator [Pseudomonadota bacterium]|nr:response regulator [Pseudomonadota bacterium]
MLKIISEVVGADDIVSNNLIDNFTSQNADYHPHILVADDFSVADNQTKRTMQQLGIDTTITHDGKEALQQLLMWANDGIDVKQHIAILISDIEMTEMDGYALTSKIRKDPRLQNIKILLHSSGSADFNNTMVDIVEQINSFRNFPPMISPSVYKH